MSMSSDCRPRKGKNLSRAQLITRKNGHNPRSYISHVELSKREKDSFKMAGEPQ